MRPVTKIATGLVIVFGTVRFNGLDLLFDPVGWGMCAAGLLLLQRPGDAFARAQASALCMVVVSLLAVLASGARTDEPFRHVIDIAATAGALVTVWLIVDALMTRMRSRGDNSRVALLDVLRWAVAGLGAAGLLAGYGYAELSSVLVVGWFAALVVLTVVLYRLAHRPYFAATRPASDGEVSST
ncbi:hypothetical protein ACFFV7_19825 [Nonomuraea spiralis]|uniref:DUF308 domain-containing protein n=1 Tax=Nonomuraea spiralis TaxID=46182 RepID=A0ABV5IFZ9_9ACTN|nr:hypothetical protein [Nonomuraea spiralis]GGT38963.1 hypothetical protein GCM10010176_098740 [Nonomuraea spiralis]